jgi:hypothetical protein
LGFVKDAKFFEELKNYQRPGKDTAPRKVLSSLLREILQYFLQAFYDTFFFAF